MNIVFLLKKKKNSNFSDVRNERLESIKNNSSFYEKKVWSECAGVAVFIKSLKYTDK